MRHENGNCTVAGGFCTAVNDPICEALHNAYDCGWRSAIAECRRQANKKKEKPPVDLTGKCGSCVYAVKDTGHFGNSQCYVRCTNKEHLNSRMYQERPLVAVRQRTAKACKRYEKRGE